MRNLQRQAVLLSLVDHLGNEGSWCGETHVQKAAFLLQQLRKVPLDFEFILYRHGPFSFDLRDELTAMRADGLLCLESMPAPYGPKLGPGDNSDLLRGRFPKTLGRYVDDVSFVAGRIGNKGVADLEPLATALFLLLETKQCEEAVAIAEKVRHLKPHISLPKAEEAAEEALAMRAECRLIAP